jgi:superfamily II RNA helicase
VDGLQRGVAAHHAGLIPTFKETVEELFVRGLVKAVFATETLALGINMPARSVVLERLVKFNGETHADITPGEYTQLTGRAGRRGIDVEGHAVVLWSPGVDPEQVAGLASTRTYPLRSSFRPSYNMAVNLVGQLSPAQARELLERSFAQFQADRAVVGLARQVDRNDEALAGYAESMRCHLGDFAEYAELRARLKERESALAREGAAQRRAAAEQSLERGPPTTPRRYAAAGRRSASRRPRTARWSTTAGCCARSPARTACASTGSSASRSPRRRCSCTVSSTPRCCRAPRRAPAGTSPRRTSGGCWTGSATSRTRSSRSG